MCNVHVGSYCMTCSTTGLLQHVDVFYCPHNNQTIRVIQGSCGNC